MCYDILMPKEYKNQTEKASSQAIGTCVALGLIAGVVIGSITGDVGFARYRFRSGFFSSKEEKTGT